MENFKEYRKNKKARYTGEISVAVFGFLIGLYQIFKGELQAGIISIGLGCVCLGYVYLLTKMEGKVYAQIDNGVLKYYENDNLVGEWNIKETEIAYRATKRNFLISIGEFDLIIIHGEDDVEILTCTQLDFLELYNDIMGIQGKEKVESVSDF